MPEFSSEPRKWKFVLPKKIALYGVSRGAIVASMVETKDPDLAAVVLVSGFYDLEKSYKALQKNGIGDREFLGIAENIRAETGGTKTAFELRSAVCHARQIRTPTLILNGEKDRLMERNGIEDFARAIRQNSTLAEVVVFPDYGHFIPFAERNKKIGPFLEKHLGASP